MNRVRWVACIGYAALLTVLLLVPNPAGVIGLRRLPAFPWGDTGVHFTGFTVLALLAHAARWPRPPGWALLVILIAYGLIVESLQGLVPSRSVEWKDYAENLLGIAAGSSVYWVVWRILLRDRRPRRSDRAR